MSIVRRIGNVVRNIAAGFFGCAMVYTRSNGYFTKGEFDGPEWQFGADYYEMQKLYARLDRGEEVSPEEMKKVVVAYCGLMHRAAYVKASYGSAMEVMEGRAEFRDE